MKNTPRLPLGHLLTVLVLGVLAYSNTFQAPFELDDVRTIVENPLVHGLSNFAPGGPGYSFDPRRWVSYVTIAFNYSVGGLSVSGFHAFNLAVHLAAAFLVYALVRLTFRTPMLVNSRIATRAGTAALLAALFFLLHPVQTQAVTYIVQRMASLATFFYLLSLVLYGAGRIRQEESSCSTPALLLVVGSVVPALLAMQTKEIAFTLPFAAALYEAFFFRGHWRKRALALFPLLLTLPLIPIQVLLVQAGSGAEVAAKLGDSGLVHTAMPRLHYFLTQLRVIVTYLRLLVLPVSLNVDYDYPVYTSPLQTPVLLSFLLLLALVAVAVLLYRRSSASTSDPKILSRDSSLRLASFGIFWFFLTLSVESSFLPLEDVIFEHRLYLPSVGLCAALAVAILLASEATTALLRGRLPIGTAFAVLAALAVATVQRNQVWGSSVRLWEDTVRKSPGKVRPWYNLGTHLGDGGQPEASIRALNRVVAMDPKHADAWHNLGRDYLLLGRFREALGPLQEAVRLKPDLDKAVVNLAVAFLKLDRPAEAVPLLERIRQKTPDLAVPRMNLGLAYVGVGNLPAALGELSFLQSAAPDLAAILANTIQRYRAAAAFRRFQ